MNFATRFFCEGLVGFSARASILGGESPGEGHLCQNLHDKIYYSRGHIEKI